MWSIHKKCIFSPLKTVFSLFLTISSLFLTYTVRANKTYFPGRHLTQISYINNVDELTFWVIQHFYDCYYLILIKLYNESCIISMLKTWDLVTKGYGICSRICKQESGSQVQVFSAPGKGPLRLPLQVTLYLTSLILASISC